MSAMQLLLFIIISVGITNLLVNASILDNLRDYVKSKNTFIGNLISCMMCSGFWIGIFISFFSFNIFPLYGGAIASVSSYIFGLLVDYLNVKIAIHANNIMEDEDKE